MRVIHNSASDLKISPPDYADIAFDLSANVVETQTDGEFDGQVVVYDRVVDRYQAATVVTSAKIEGPVTGQVIYASLDPGIATIDSDGNVSRVSDGTARIVACRPPFKRRVDVDVQQEGGVVNDTWVGWDAGWLAKYITDGMNSRFADLSPADIEYAVHDRGTASWRTDHWLYDVDLTGWSYYSDQYGWSIRCTAITPRHYLLSAHVSPYTSDATIQFLSRDSTLVDMNSTGEHSSQVVSPYTGNALDCVVGAFTEDLPATITPMKILPDEWQAYLPTDSARVVDGTLSYEFARLPIVRLNQDSYAMAGEGGVAGAKPLHATEDATIASLYGVDLRSGDSSSPGLALIDSAPVLLTIWTYGIGGGGPLLAGASEAINTAIAEVDAALGISTGYEIGTVDLSGYESTV
jgi:hypothetical protein